MASKRSVYPSEIRHSPEGEKLYTYWRKIKSGECDPAFIKFLDFYNWAVSNGYELDARLYQIDTTKPYGPNNCAWSYLTVPDRLSRKEERIAAAKWNKAVNSIRVHFGMEPFPVEEFDEEWNGVVV